MNKIEGIISEVFEIQSFKNSQKREFILETQGEYPQKIKLELWRDFEKLDMLNGKPVEVAFELRGREWINPKGEKVYFNSVNAVSIRDLTAFAKTEEEPRGEKQEVRNDDLPF